MPSSRMSLIIPVETQSREFDAKLLLACVAAERGFPVIMGQRTEIHMKISSMPRSIYLAKDMRQSSLRMFEIMHKLGHEIVAWDEEGLVPYDREREYKIRFCAASMSHVSDIFAWGEENADMIKGFPAYKDAPVHVTGNVRFDMMRAEFQPFFDEEVAKIRERFGKFVLINTNFGANNHYIPELSLVTPGSQPGKSIASRQSQRYDAGLIKYRTALFSKFLEFVPAIAGAFPSQHFIIRPHPAENHDPWESAAAGLDNIDVVHEGSVVPWLLASTALIHNNCTTGIEAFVMRVPAISYRPIASEEFDRDLPNALCYEMYDFDSLCAKLRSIIDGQIGSCDAPAQWGLIELHLASLDGKLASERIIDVLDQDEAAFKQGAKPSVNDFLGGWFEAVARGARKRLNALKPGHKNSAQYQRRRFPGISLEEVRDRMGRFRRLLGRFSNLEVDQISRNIFRIKAN